MAISAIAVARPSLQMGLLARHQTARRADATRVQTGVVDRAATRNRARVTRLHVEFLP